MKTFAIQAKQASRIAEIRAKAEARGLLYDETDPSFIISVGGDGTFLAAEREFPGIPKLAVRDSLVCFKCHNEPLDEMLAIIGSGKWKVMSTAKLRCVVAGRDLLATNDVVVRNRDPRHALRFRIFIDGKEFDEEFIGDGIVAATPFGSTGYYRSITRTSFEQGIGVAFNNCAGTTEPLRLDENMTLDVQIARSDAHLSVDNHPELLILSRGDSALVRKAEQETQLVGHQ